MNFHRGFDQWTWIRDQESDPYRSGSLLSLEEIEKYIPENLRKESKGGWTRKKFSDFIGEYLTNIADKNGEEDYFPAQVSREGARWLEQNQEFLFLELLSCLPNHFKRPLTISNMQRLSQSSALINPTLGQIGSGVSSIEQSSQSVQYSILMKLILTRFAFRLR